LRLRASNSQFEDKRGDKAFKPAYLAGARSMASSLPHANPQSYLAIGGLILWPLTANSFARLAQPAMVAAALSLT
jgi:hypothetical protein